MLSPIGSWVLALKTAPTFSILPPSRRLFPTALYLALPWARRRLFPTALYLAHPWARLAVVVLLASTLLGACGGAPLKETTTASTAAIKASSTTASKAGNTAVSMLGKPYRYGGYSPKGFDCSGLVYYSYSRAGIQVPRSSAAQSKAARPISINNLRKGDLLFFDQDGKRSSHVAIYVGDGNFVHAPSTGKRVRIDRLHDAYWKKHFVDARRFTGT